MNTAIPRYLTDTSLDVDTVLRAESIFERYLGHQLAASPYCDTIPYSQHSGAALVHTPIVSLERVCARTHRWHVGLRQYESLGTTDWAEIDVAHTVLHQKDDRAALIVPVSLFGQPYDELRVTYVAGVVDIPADVLDAVQAIYDGLRSGEITEWNCVLPLDVYDTIQRYVRKEGTGH